MKRLAVWPPLCAEFRTTLALCVEEIERGDGDHRCGWHPMNERQSELAVRARALLDLTEVGP